MDWLFNVFLLRAIVWVIPRAILVFVILIPICAIIAWILQLAQVFGFWPTTV